MKTDKELADELDAQDRLLARGWKKKTCPICKGTGCFNAINTGQIIHCRDCQGKGHSWEAPIEK